MSEIRYRLGLSALVPLADPYRGTHTLEASIRRWAGCEDWFSILMCPNARWRDRLARLVAVVSTLLFGLRLFGLGGQELAAGGGPQMRV